MKPFFADTYAILAAIRGDPAYSRRFQQARSFRTGNWNLLEALYVQISQGVPRDVAAHRLAPFLGAVLREDWRLLQKAAKIRLDFRAKGSVISTVDAVGFALATDAKLPFLTGDPAFRHVPEAEFLAARRGSVRKGS